MQNKFFEPLIVLSCSILLTLCFLWPTLPHLTTQFIGDGGDNYEYASYMGLTARHIQESIYPLQHTDFWRYPVGIDFQRSFDSYITLSIGTALTLLLSLPFSYNLTLLILMTLNGMLSYIYFKFLSKSQLLGMLGMSIYGFSFYSLAKVNAHPNLLLIGVFPFALFTFLRLCTKTEPKYSDFLLFFLAAVFSSFASMQYAVILFLFFIMFFLVSFFSYKIESLAFITKVMRSKKEMIFAALTAGVVFAIFFSPQILSVVQGTFEFKERGGTLASTTPGMDNLFRPNKYLHLLISKITTSDNRESIESMTFIGWVELVAFFFFFKSRQITTHFKTFIGVLFGIPFLLSLGYGVENQFPLLPYRFLANVPLFAIVAETGRYFTLFYLVTATAIILFLKSLPKKTFLLVTVAILLGVIVERLPETFRVVPTQKNAYTEAVQKENSKAVLDLPINLYTPRYNILSLWYEKPIVNGYFHWSADGKNQRSFLENNALLLRYTCSEVDPMLTTGMRDNEEKAADDKLLATLKDNGITTIVIHKDDKFYHTACRNIRLRLARLGSSVTTLTETKEQKEMIVKAWDSKPTFTFYFPTDGMFYLDGVYIAPDSPTTFVITKNNSAVDFYYSWGPVGSPNALELLPKDKFQLPVTAGTMYTFSANDYVASTYFSLWYRYIPLAKTNSIPYNSPLLKVFENEEAVVYRIQ